MHQKYCVCAPVPAGAFFRAQNSDFEFSASKIALFLMFFRVGAPRRVPRSVLGSTLEVLRHHFEPTGHFDLHLEDHSRIGAMGDGGGQIWQQWLAMGGSPLIAGQR